MSKIDWNNKEEVSEYQKQYRETHKEKIKQYNKTPFGRASNLVSTYKDSDRKHNRGECTLTAKWVVENIFGKKCAHCDKSDWREIGCNRLDNSKPHTPENVEPCCDACNKELAGKKDKQVIQLTLNGEIVAIWPSTMECGRNGYINSCVSACCRGERKTHKGYLWNYML